MFLISIDKLQVKKFLDQQQMGMAAARDVSKKIQELLLVKDEINMVFAAAPSQNEFLKYLMLDININWSRINAFHMDEYIGLDSSNSESFSYFLKEKIFSLADFKTVNYINGSAKDLLLECEKYSKLITKAPIDIVCLGIGENGHLAFNDPHTADFKDKEITKIVTLDLECKIQQVNDGCFASVDLVPKKAITITIPTLLSADFMFCVVPGKTKAKAVKKTLFADINEECPSTILRRKENTTLYLDSNSSSLIELNSKEKNKTH